MEPIKGGHFPRGVVIGEDGANFVSAGPDDITTVTDRGTVDLTGRSLLLLHRPV